MSSSLVFLTARISALSDRLLTASDTERMVSAETFSEAFRVLNDISWSGVVADAPNADDFERVIDIGLYEIRQSLYESDIPKSLAQFLFLPFDLQNAKCTLLSFQKGKSYDDFRESLSPLGFFERKLSFRILAGEEENTPKEAVFLKKALQESYLLLRDDSQDREEILSLLDAAVFRQMFRAVCATKSKVLSDFFQKQIDWENAKKVLRNPSQERYSFLLPQEEKGFRFFSREEALKHLYSSSATSLFSEGVSLKESGRDLSLFEATAELSLLQSLFWSSRLSPLSCDTVVLFFLTKLRNAEIIRTILVGKRNKQSTTDVRKAIAHFLPFLPR